MLREEEQLLAPEDRHSPLYYLTPVRRTQRRAVEDYRKIEHLDFVKCVHVHVCSCVEQWANESWCFSCLHVHFFCRHSLTFTFNHCAFLGSRYPYDDLSSWKHFRKHMEKQLLEKSIVGLQLLSHLPEELEVC